jgi:hypothetical protein
MHTNSPPPSGREPDYVSRPESDERGTSPGHLLLASFVVIAIGLATLWWLMNRAG